MKCTKCNGNGVWEQGVCQACRGSGFVLVVTFDARFTMPSRELAVEITKMWGRETLKGHSLWARQEDGSNKVTLHGALEIDKPWLETTINNLINRKP